MKSRQWRPFCVEWPHMAAGHYDPASCSSRKALLPTPPQVSSVAGPAFSLPEGSDEDSVGSA